MAKSYTRLDGHQLESLQTFVADVHSQFGEDGIVSEILDRRAHYANDFETFNNGLGATALLLEKDL